MLLASILLCLFTGIAGVDGFYYHLYRYRLHERPECRYEHLLHTINACLFVPQVLLMFSLSPRGAFLWLTAALCVGILVVELFDVLSENDSRRQLGGLTPTEYAMHFLMSGLRMGFVAAFFVATPVSDFFAPTELAIPSAPRLVFGLTVALPSLGAAALHVWLAIVGRRAKTPAAAAAA